MPQNNIADPTNSDRQSWHRLKRDAMGEFRTIQYSVDDEIWAVMEMECSDRGWLLKDGYQRAIQSLIDYVWYETFQPWHLHLGESYGIEFDISCAQWGHMTKNWDWGLAKSRGRRRREFLLPEFMVLFLAWGCEHSAFNRYATLTDGDDKIRPARKTVPMGAIIDKAIYSYFGFEQFENTRECTHYGDIYGDFDLSWMRDS